MNRKNKNYIIRNIRTDKGEEDEIYTGEIGSIKELNESEEYFANLKGINKRQFFKQYCQLLTEISRKGKITRQTAAYMIAGWMFDSELKAIPEIEDIVLLAGKLEVPYHIATDSGDKQAYDMEWNKLIDKINDLKF